MFWLRICIQCLFVFFYDILCKRSRVQGQYITIHGNVVIKKITLAPYN